MDGSRVERWNAQSRSHLVLRTFLKLLTKLGETFGTKTPQAACPSARDGSCYLLSGAEGPPCPVKMPGANHSD